MRRLHSLPTCDVISMYNVTRNFLAATCTYVLHFFLNSHAIKGNSDAFTRSLLLCIHDFDRFVI